MAAASDFLKRMCVKYPILDKIRQIKNRLWQAMSDKGLNPTESMDEWPATLNNLKLSIDSIIEKNGYTHNFGTEAEPFSLATVLKEQFEYGQTLAESEVYSSNQFRNDSKLLYLTEKPLSADMSYFCHDASALSYIPQLDFSNVKKLYYTFNNTRMQYIEPIYETYTVDFSSLTSWQYSPFGFTRHLNILNMNDNCYMYQTFMDSTESIDGLNMSGMNIFPWPMGGTQHFRNRKHIGFKDGSIIRYADVIACTLKEPTTPINYKWDVETLYGMCVCAYDWTTNPRNLTFAEYHLASGSNKEYHYLNYHFSDGNKAALEAAYPDVDFKTLMEAKGWTY